MRKGETKLKKVIQFFKKAFNFFRMEDYNTNLKRQAHQFNLFKDKGKAILAQVVEEFNKLNAPPDSVCKLVDNETKLLIKFLGVSVLIGIDKLQDRYGSLVIYKADRWSLEWEDYTIPVNADLQFDNSGNIFIQNTVVDGVVPPAYIVLEHIVNILKYK